MRAYALRHNGKSAFVLENQKRKRHSMARLNQTFKGTQSGGHYGILGSGHGARVLGCLECTVSLRMFK